MTINCSEEIQHFSSAIHKNNNRYPYWCFTILCDFFL